MIVNTLKMCTGGAGPEQSLVLFFDQPTVLGFGNRFGAGHLSADYRPTVGRLHL